MGFFGKKTKKNRGLLFLGKYGKILVANKNFHPKKTTPKEALFYHEMGKMSRDRASKKCI